MPSLKVVTAVTLVIAAWVAEGFVKPLIVNIIGLKLLRCTLDVTVKTIGPVPLRAAVPDPKKLVLDVYTYMKLTLALPEFARAMPAPLSVMMILPLQQEIVDVGVIATLMVTDVAPRTTLLKVMVGALMPRDVPKRMAGYVPVTLDPTMVVPSFKVVAAATLVIAAWVAVGLVNPVMVIVMDCPPVNMFPVVLVDDTVKTNGPAPLRAATPKGALPVKDGMVKTEALPEFARAMPAPLSVMMILPLLATVDTGVSVTVMVTDVAPRATLLRVMVGAKVPRDVPARVTMFVSARS